MRRIVVRERERIVELSTMDYLKLLEAERRIQSADAVFERALEAGRTPSRAEKFVSTTLLYGRQCGASCGRLRATTSQPTKLDGPIAQGRPAWRTGAV